MLSCLLASEKLPGQDSTDVLRLSTDVPQGGGVRTTRSKKIKATQINEKPREKVKVKKNQEVSREILAYCQRWREFPVVPHYWGTGKPVMWIRILSHP